MKTLTSPNVVLGVQVKPFNRSPDLTIHRFRVYKREPISLLEPEAQKLNYNFQIEGDEGEKLVLRILMNEDGTFKRGSYHSNENFDSEIAEYLVKALVQKLGLPVKDFTKLPLKLIAITQAQFNPEEN